MTLFADVPGPILVTGAGGFIGQNVMRAILRERRDVIGIIRGSLIPTVQSAESGNFAMGNLADSGFITQLLNSLRPETVIHSASYGNSSDHRKVEEIYKTNLVDSVRLAEEAASINVKSFISLGSSSEYGHNSNRPTEEAVCEPNSHYAISKKAFTDVLLDMYRRTGFPGITLRLYSVYGPFENRQRLVPSALQRAKEGSLISFTHPEVSRDFVFVADVVEAIAKVAERAGELNANRIFNIGTGTKTTIGGFANLIRSEFHIAEEPKFGEYPPRSWDIPDWFSNSDLAERKLDWHPKVALREGLRLTYEWLDSDTGKKFLAWEPGKPNESHPQRGRSISAVVACYKDEQAIPEMYARLSQVLGDLGVDYEIILVNDGSPDNTEEVIRKISETDPKVLGVTHSRNFGSQMAFRSGMELAKMDAVVLLDGDLQDTPEVISEMHMRWVEGFDVVYGIRSGREMSWLQEIPYRMFYRINRWLSGGRIPLDAGDFSLIDRKVMTWILASPERDLLIRGLRAYVGFRQTGVEYFRPKRKYGKSTNSFLANIAWAKKAFFSFSEKPLAIITNTGFIVLALSFSAAIFTLLWRVIVPDETPDGVTTVVLAVLFFGSLNLFAIGIIGEYLGKVLVEVKRRPRLVRSHLIRMGFVADVGESPNEETN